MLPAAFSYIELPVISGEELKQWIPPPLVEAALPLIIQESITGADTKQAMPAP